jgi:hypothetical protein
MKVIHGAIIRTPRARNLGSSLLSLLLLHIRSATISYLSPSNALNNNDVDDVELVAELPCVAPPGTLNLCRAIVLIFKGVAGKPSPKKRLNPRCGNNAFSKPPFREPSPEIRLYQNQRPQPISRLALSKTTPHLRLDRNCSSG